MPIYEYQCQECGQKARKLWKSFSSINEKELVCPRCGKRKFKRLVSLVSVMDSEDTRMEKMTRESRWADVDENDPKSLGRFMRKMTQELGDEAGDLGPEFDEIVGRLEAGEDPEKIEKKMEEMGIDLPEGPGGPGGGGDDFVDL